MEDLIINVFGVACICAFGYCFVKFIEYKIGNDKSKLEEKMIKEGRIYHFIYEPYKIDGYYDYETFKGLNDMVIGDCAHNHEYYIWNIGKVEVLTDKDNTIDYEELRGITICKYCGSITNCGCFVDKTKNYKCYRCHDGEDFEEETAVEETE